MKIFIYNDKKEKPQLFRAYLDSIDVDMWAYGSTGEEAVANLYQEIYGLIESLEELQYKQPVEVDYNGEAIG